MSRDTSRQSKGCAVVVGAGINGLGVLRSLVRGAVPTTVLGNDASQPAMHSRYGRKVVFEGEQDAVISTLEKLAAETQGEKPLLILTQEDTVAAVSAQRDRLQALYRIVLPPHDVLTSLLHKDGFRAIAETAHAIIPSTLHITSADDIERVAALQPPLVVKPAVRDAGYASACHKAYRVDSVEAAQAQVREILPTLSDIVVQEWIEGLDTDIYFCLQYITQAGATAASFVGRKIRSWPPRVGGTASCAQASAEEAELLTERTTAFFSHVGVHGFASMEYKRDTRSGEFFMVEPTVGRTDYQEEVATLNGVNIPLAACRAEFGLSPMPEQTHKPPLIWRDRMADIQSEESGDGADLWRPEQARTVDALWRATDPMPAIAPLALRITRRVRRMLVKS